MSRIFNVMIVYISYQQWMVNVEKNVNNIYNLILLELFFILFLFLLTIYCASLEGNKL